MRWAKWVPVPNYNEMCSQWPVPSLQASHQTGGLWELLLHFPFLQGQDYSCMQLLHLHSVHPAGTGETRCRIDVLGSHEAPEGNVHCQIGLLSQRDVMENGDQEGYFPTVILWTPRKLTTECQLIFKMAQY